MHLKSYQVDGHVLRTGAANFSASGPATFKHAFEAPFISGKALSLAESN